jgi:hypothetical protein
MHDNPATPTHFQNVSNRNHATSKPSTSKRTNSHSKTPLVSKRPRILRETLGEAGSTTGSRGEWFKSFAENIMTPSDDVEAFGGFVVSTIKALKTRKQQKKSMREVHILLHQLSVEEEEEEIEIINLI